jgi:hypothetical protein
VKRRAYEQSRKRGPRLSVDRSEGSWYDFHHTHTDPRGLGNRTSGARKHFLRCVRSRLLETVSQLKGWSTPHQVWAIIDSEDSGQNAVYLHTPNENGTAFPHDFANVLWSGPVPPWVSSIFPPEHYRVGSSNIDGHIYYTVVGHDT